MRKVFLWCVCPISRTVEGYAVGQGADYTVEQAIFFSSFFFLVLFLFSSFIAHTHKVYKLHIFS